MSKALCVTVHFSRARRAHRNLIKRYTKHSNVISELKRTYPWLSHFCSGSGKVWGHFTKISLGAWSDKNYVSFYYFNHSSSTNWIFLSFQLIITFFFCTWLCFLMMDYQRRSFNDKWICINHQNSRLLISWCCKEFYVNKCKLNPRITIVVITQLTHTF